LNLGAIRFTFLRSLPHLLTRTEQARTYMEPNKFSGNKPVSIKPLYRGTRIVWYLTILLEVVLMFRFFLKLLAANPSAGFTVFIYAVSAPFVAPFNTVFGITKVEGSIFEWTTLLAMLVYWIIGWAIAKLFLISRPVSREEAAKKLEEQD
jgi:hypothetical protein